MSLKTFESTTDYDVPLLRLLQRLPGGQGKPVEVRGCFEAEYGQLIPETHRERNNDGKLKWKTALSWAAYRLRQHAMVDSVPGIWRITEAGRRWLEENPEAARLPWGRRKRYRKRGSPSGTQVPGLTLELLEQTRQLMPSDQFRALWSEIYDQLLAEHRPRAITDVSQAEIGRRGRRRLDEVHAFLLGKSTPSPSSEVLCDWIHFCYALELQREPAALLPYVGEDEVDPAIYKRAKRVAQVCRSKLAG